MPRIFFKIIPKFAFKGENPQVGNPGINKCLWPGPEFYVTVKNVHTVAVFFNEKYREMNETVSLKKILKFKIL
jgi:hypothetical protein